MSKPNNNQKFKGFLSRLRSDTSGNVMMLMAAGIIPTIGLIGGGLDMSRVYLVRTRMQAACDAGALMGRKIMAGGTWASTNGKAEAEAKRIFDMNFENRSYGSKPVTRTFVEDPDQPGNVVGNASTTLPMTLMQVVGIQKEDLAVECSAEQRIPDSDVMFVLDNTGSMNWDPNGNTTGVTNSKIYNLKIAVKCFYETLTQRNISDISPSQCGETQDPVTSSSNISVIRFGFVPFTSDVNVGRLLPLQYIADTWPYQTRTPNFNQVYQQVPTLGTPGPITQTNQTTTTQNGTAQQVQNNVNIGGQVYPVQIKVKTNINCAVSAVPPPPQTSTTTNTTGGGAQPVYPGTSVTNNWVKTDTTTVTTYSYVQNGTKRCDLYSTANSTIVKTFTQQITPITAWTNTLVNSSFKDWTYDKHTVNVSGLKDTGNNAWNQSLSLPQGNNGAQINVQWDGCIEERATLRNVSAWYPTPTGANDMDIDLIPDPTNHDTLWGPRLQQIQWGRGTSGGSKTMNPVTTANDTFGITQRACPQQSRIHQVWDSDAYANYVNSMNADGSTYLDIGLLWGARLASPQGIFSENNDPENQNVQRHMVFMTDGEVSVNTDEATAYGWAWYDRRQTDPGSAPSSGQLSQLNYDRYDALCTAIKNKNITLWVIGYGNGVTSTSRTHLMNCASSGKYFDATTNAALNAQFKSIAQQISALRLTG